MGRKEGRQADGRERKGRERRGGRGVTQDQDGALGGSEENQLSWVTCGCGSYRRLLLPCLCSSFTPQNNPPAPPQLTPAPLSLAQGHHTFSPPLLTVPTADVLSQAPVTPSAYYVAPGSHDFLFPETSSFPVANSLRAATPSPSFLHPQP